MVIQNITLRLFSKIPQIQLVIHDYVCFTESNLYTPLSRSGDSKGTFWSLSQAATCIHVYYTMWSLKTAPFYC